MAGRDQQQAGEVFQKGISEQRQNREVRRDGATATSEKGGAAGKRYNLHGSVIRQRTARAVKECGSRAVVSQKVRTGQVVSSVCMGSVACGVAGKRRGGKRSLKMRQPAYVQGQHAGLVNVQGGPPMSGWKK